MTMRPSDCAARRRTRTEDDLANLAFRLDDADLVLLRLRHALRRAPELSTLLAPVMEFITDVRTEYIQTRRTLIETLELTEKGTDND